MPGALPVLVVVLIAQPLIFLFVLFTASRLARRTGQQLKSVSRSSTHGYTAEFDDNH